ncbi:rubrerythrin [Anoxybacter fermentans]|uniref:Rubrerythrin n=1 Tax=Anoxybacter fermentans TaxID=1323375 RepID=A0A3Q9HQH2_9FIRM|nr:ferritin-like domain-containing protein [Anoxybacter fermentans]AZR73261.1 rubrerythrin [Anoxybacter fermentans]
MSYTTDRQPQGYPYFPTNKIREAMIGELVAINDYAYHISHSDIEEINEIWQHIMDDEKRHYGMFLDLLRKYDPAQYEMFKKVKKQIHINKKIKNPTCSSKKYNQDLILNYIRNDIKGELEAIILYEQHITEIPCKEVREVFHKIINDEKEHVEELTIVLLKYDKDKYGPISMNK